MAEINSPFDASASALGYLYQCRYALFLVLQQDDPMLALSIEKLDDVAFHETPSSPAKARDLLQFKHHLTRQGSLGDSSPDIWKSLRIWAEGVKNSTIALNGISLALITTTSATDRNAVRFLRADRSIRNPSEAMRVLETAGSESRNPLVQEAFTSLSSLTHDQRRQLFASIYLLDGSLNIVDLEKALLTSIRYVVRRQFQKGFLQRLEGWWWQRVIRHLTSKDNDLISSQEIQDQIHEIQDQYRRDSLPDDLLHEDVPTDATPDDDDRVFIQQLRLIDLPELRIRSAQEDYYRAFTQRSRWLKEKLLATDEATTYERRLIDGWRERFLIMIESIADRQDDLLHIRHGQGLYGWIATESPGRSDLWIRIDFRSGYMTRGSYHMLSDDKRVGWHPHYETHLKNQNGDDPEEQS